MVMTALSMVCGARDANVAPDGVSIRARHAFDCMAEEVDIGYERNALVHMGKSIIKLSLKFHGNFPPSLPAVQRAV